MMISCRPVCRIDRLWRTARAAGAPSSTSYYSQMGRAKDASILMNLPKKQKTATPMRKAVSTKSVWVVKGLHTNQIQPPEVVGCSERSPIGCCVDEVQNKITSTISDSHEASQDEPVTVDTHQELVEDEIMQDMGSEADPESTNKVEKHSVCLEVGASLMRFVKGKGGSTQKQIEERMGVKIIFPSSKEDTRIVIEGSSTESVTRASEEIESVLEEAVKSPSLDYSHFISLPLAIYPELVEKLYDFQKTILGNDSSSHGGNLESDSDKETSNDGDDEDYQKKIPNVAVKLEVREEEHVAVKLDAKYKANILSDMGIDKSIFIKPRTFHLTVLMLKLWNKDRVAAATEVLQKISSKVNDALNNKPVLIKLKGLECMKGSPAKARVLYAPVKEIGAEGRLLRACEIIIEAYIEAGLVLEKDARQALKLHATLMNARHRKRMKKARKYDSFDARWILARYGSEEWGDYLIREAHLSQRFSFDDTGYYHCCASIPFPEKAQAD